MHMQFAGMLNRQALPLAELVNPVTTCESIAIVFFALVCIIWIAGGLYSYMGPPMDTNPAYIIIRS
jgi:hypothetical protein